MVGRQAGRREVLGEHPHRRDAAEALGGDRLADEPVEVALAHRLVEGWRDPHPLLGVGHHGVGERRELGVLVLLVPLPVHGGDSSRRRPTEQVRREVGHGVDDGVRAGGHEGRALPRTPGDRDGGHPGGPRGEHVDGGVADVDAVGRGRRRARRRRAAAGRASACGAVGVLQRRDDVDEAGRCRRRRRASRAVSRRFDVATAQCAPRPRRGRRAARAPRHTGG